MEEIRRRKVVSFCALPLTTARRQVGALSLGSVEPVVYTPADVGFLREVTKLVSVAVDNALNFDEGQAMPGPLSAERDPPQPLLDGAQAIASHPAPPPPLSA